MCSLPLGATLGLITQRGERGASHGNLDAALQTHVHRVGRRRRRGLLPVRTASRDECADCARPDPGRLSRSETDSEVHDAAARPAGDAAGGHAHRPGRQARRLLRDLDAAARPADPAVGHADDDGLGLRRGDGAEQERAEDSQRPIAHDRGQVEAGGPGQVDQRAQGRGREFPAPPAAGRPDAALGEPARRGDGTRHAADVHGDARPVYGPGADRDPRARRRGGGRRQRRLRRGLVPARCEQPGGLRHGGHLVRVLPPEGRRRLRHRLGARLRRLPVPERQPRLDDLVSRPRARHDSPERLRGPGRLLPDPRRRGRRRARLADRAARRAARPGAARERHVPAQQAVPGDPDRDPRSCIQRGRGSVLSRTRGRSSTSTRGPTSPTPTSRRSGTPSSSGTRSWSTATRGRS